MKSIIRFSGRSPGPRAVAVAAVSLALAGCFVQQDRIDEGAATAQVAYARCDQQRSTVRYMTHLDAVDCAVPTVVAAYREAGYPFTDLLYVSIQARRIGAGKVDAGEATEAEYQREVAVLDARIATEETRRREAINSGGSLHAAAPETMLQGLSALTPTPDAAALPPLPAGADNGCIPLGGIRECK